MSNLTKTANINPVNLLNTEPLPFFTGSMRTPNIPKNEEIISKIISIVLDLIIRGTSVWCIFKVPEV